MLLGCFAVTIVGSQPNSGKYFASPLRRIEATLSFREKWKVIIRTFLTLIPALTNSLVPIFFFCLQFAWFLGVPSLQFVNLTPKHVCTRPQSFLQYSPTYNALHTRESPPGPTPGPAPPGSSQPGHQGRQARPAGRICQK